MIARTVLGLVGVLALNVGGRELSAQQAGSRPFAFGVTANMMSIDAATAASQQVGTRSWGAQIDFGGVFKRYLYVAADIGPQHLDDQAQFTQNTTGGLMKSSADIVYFSAMAGPRTAPLKLVPGLPAIALGLYAGASATTGKRSIDNCSDCRADDITIPGGSFVQPTLLFGSGGRARVRLSDRYFVTGDGMRSVVSLGLELGGR